MKRGKKSLLLAGALLVLIVAYVGAQNWSKTPETVQEESGEYALVSRKAEELVRLEWTTEEESFAFAKKDGVWEKEGEEGFPVKQEAVEALAETLAGLQAQRKLENVEKAEDYGFAQPSFSVKALWSDGTETVYEQGDETPFADGYYLRGSEDGQTIYITEDSLADGLAGSRLSFASAEELPQPENVTRITAGAADLRLSDGVWIWNATGERLDADKAQELVDEAENLEWNGLAAVNVTEEELADYGLKEENATLVALYDGEEAVWELLLGGENDDGERYARLPGSQTVYTLNASDISGLSGATVDSLYERTLTAATEEEIVRLTVKADGRSLEFLPQESEEAEAGENAAEEATAAQTEEDEEPAAFQQLFEKLTALTATARVEESAKGEPLMELALEKQDGSELVYSFYLYDEDSYLAPMEEGAARLFQANALDALLRKARLLDMAK